MGCDGSFLRTENLRTIHLPIYDKCVEKTKLIDVINSCVSLRQLMVAEKYMHLWFKKYNETDGEIEKIFFSKKMKLNNGWESKN